MTGRRRAAALLFLLLLLALPPAASAQRRGALAGRVVDAATGRPLAGIEVQALSYGSDRYVGAHPSFSAGAAVRAAAASDFELVTGGAIGGRATGDGAPLAGIEIRLQSDDRRNRAIAVSDGQGRYVARGLPRGSYTLSTGGAAFGDRANPEVAVRMVDACATFGRFWTFAAGLTDRFAEVTVIDSETGARWTYASGHRTPFPAVLDTAGLDVCLPASGSGPRHAPAGDRPRGGPEPGVPQPARPPVRAGPGHRNLPLPIGRQPEVPCAPPRSL